ncbi:hypothetical protein Afil01_08770 [Actinorhabdospora filicis]|uniref:Uncharacterized protein n=2 Tax=Actinorhabdospora filicis TaxID=1785913 RepID=A0A9W6W8X0_9ACTN|nr:hypothetical protein Afil01_08770 [Actinorhabdospora filicis]
MLELAARNQARGCGIAAVLVAGSLIVMPMFAMGGSWYAGIGTAVVVIGLGLAVGPMNRRWQATRLEIGDDAIVAHSATRVVKRIERTPTGTLQVASNQHARVLRWLEGGRSIRAMLLVHPVDGEEFERALVRHGWTPGAVVEESREEPPSRSTTLVLAEGVRRIGARSPLLWVLVAIGLVPVVLTVGGWEPGRFALGHGLLVPWFIALGVAYLGLSVYLRHHEVLVSARKIVYRAGTVTRECRRERAAVTATATHAVITAGAASLRIPFKGERERLLALLREMGWPAPY